MPHLSVQQLRQGSKRQLQSVEARRAADVRTAALPVPPQPPPRLPAPLPLPAAAVLPVCWRSAPAPGLARWWSPERGARWRPSPASPAAARRRCWGCSCRDREDVHCPEERGPHWQSIAIQYPGTQEISTVHIRTISTIHSHNYLFSREIKHVNRFIVANCDDSSFIGAICCDTGETSAVDTATMSDCCHARVVGCFK